MASINCDLSCIYFIVNIIYLVAGITFIAIGIQIFYNAKSIEEYWTADSNLEQLSKVVIPIGAFILAIGIFGYMVWCFYSESFCLLTIYIILVGILLAITIIISICVLDLSPESTYSIKKSMRGHQAKYNNEASSRRFWDGFQSIYICCGIDNRTDWLEYMPEPPRSCCQEHPDPLAKSESSEVQDPYCKAHNAKQPYLQFTGCFQKINDMHKKHQTTLVIIVCIACCSQGICFILSIILVVNRKNEPHQYE